MTPPMLDSTSAADTVTVSIPTLTTASDGLSMVTFGKGKGKAIKDGQKATVGYTGFLAADGTIFDYATAHSPPVSVGPVEAIQGFYGASGRRPAHRRPTASG